MSNKDGGKLIEVIDGHSQELIIKKLMEQPLELREMVEEVCIDMWFAVCKNYPTNLPKCSASYRQISCDEATSK